VTWERATPEFLALIDSGLTYAQLRAHGCYRDDDPAPDRTDRTTTQTTLLT
jgi:hypothetical protein